MTRMPPPHESPDLFAGEPISPGRDRQRAGRLIVRRHALERVRPRGRTDGGRAAPRPVGPPGLPGLRPLASSAHHLRVRRGIRRTGRSRPGRHRLRLGAGHGGGPVYAQARELGRPPGAGGLRGHHRRRARRHGGGEPGLPRGRRVLRRLQHRAAPRAVAQPVRGPRGRVPLLLRPQDDVREVRRRVRHLARRVRDARRAVRGADPHPDRQDPALPGLPGRDELLERPVRLAARPAPCRAAWSTRPTSTCSP